MKRNNLGVAAIAARLLVVVGLLAVVAHGQSTQVTVTGFVTDTLSGRRGANDLHGDASKRSVAAGMAVYAVYDEATKKLYVLQPQGVGATYVAQRVTVTGTLAPSAMQHAGQHVNPQTNVTEDFHRVGQDSTTPIGGVLTITSIVVAKPGPPAKATSRQ
jgi:hypothetical protein